MISLNSKEIHLWLAFYDEGIERDMPSYRKILSVEEREQELRFRFIRDQQRYLVTRVLVRTVLSRYIRIAPHDWIFSTNAFGRPTIVNAEAADEGLLFNISHTRSLIVLGVSKGRAIGVDVENFNVRKVSIDLANRFFAPDEARALVALSANRQQYRFFEYWTFKESYIKARGMGLSLPLDKFSFFYPDDHSVILTIEPELSDYSARWQFWQIPIGFDYLIAICAERLGTEPSQIVIRQLVSMLNEQTLDVTFLRTSK